MSSTNKKYSLIGKTTTILAIISSLIFTMIMTSVVYFKYFNDDLLFLNIISALRQNARGNSYILSYETAENALNNKNIFITTPSIDLNKYYLDNRSLVPNSLKETYNKVYRMNIKMNNYIAYNDSNKYLKELPIFIKEIDVLQNQFFNYLDRKISIIHLFYLIINLIIVFISVSFIMFLRDKIIKPLNHITESTALIENNLEEFDKLDVYNEVNIAKLSDSLKTLIHSSKVNLNNNSLDQSLKVSSLNKQLSILYQISQSITPATISPKLLNNILENLFNNLGLLYLELVLDDINIEFGKQSKTIQIEQVELTFDNKSFGFFKYQQNNANDNFDRNLLKQIAQVITRSWSIFKLQKQQEYLSILEERSVIARELHDSLAQVLSFLKIQVNLLKLQIKRNTKDEQTLSLLNDIDNALKDAYTQLRELLSTFRLTVEDANLKDTLQGITKSLQERTDIVIREKCNIPDDSFSPADLIHILQIVREAILNSIKHSNAKHIDVIATMQKNNYEIIIKDDGIGLKSHVSPLNHYGLSIMSERAKTLNAQIFFANDNGLEIRLVIPISKKTFKNII